MYVSLSRDRPVPSLLITGGGRFPQILELFQGLKIEFPSGCLGETSILKIIMIDDVIVRGQSSNLHGKSTRFY